MSDHSKQTPDAGRLPRVGDRYHRGKAMIVVTHVTLAGRVHWRMTDPLGTSFHSASLTEFEAMEAGALRNGAQFDPAPEKEGA